ncbi:MAG: hypothetical protein HZT43_04250 [Exiguobacterium profundum]|nr:MAG: hypothetical protein HZT43_04250 [Exiguobacterium profundum]
MAVGTPWPGAAPGTPERAAFLSWFVFTNNALHTGAMDLLHPERPGRGLCCRGVRHRAGAAGGAVGGDGRHGGA